MTTIDRGSLALSKARRTNLVSTLFRVFLGVKLARKRDRLEINRGI